MDSPMNSAPPDVDATDRVLRELPSMKDLGTRESFGQAGLISEAMIIRREFDPI